jgi:hypothetical protein
MPRAAGFLPALALVLAASAFPAAGDGVRPLTASGVMRTPPGRAARTSHT